MRIVARYVFGQAIGALLLILLSLSGIVWIALALRQLNVVTAQGQDVWLLLSMTTLALPNLMALIAPVALLIATIHTLNRLSSDSELIVLTAAGATVWTIARPLLLLALLVSVAVASVNHYVMPWSLRLLRDLVIQVRTDLLTQVIQPGRFSSPESGLTFHIRERALNGDLKGLLMHDMRDPKVVTTYLAETGTLIKQDDHAYLMMRAGHVLRRTSTAEPPQIVEFESYVVNLDRFEPKTASIELKPRERYFSELAFPRADDSDFKRQPGHFRAELHERFANPFYAFAFVLLAVALIGRAQSTRQNRWEAIALAGTLCVGARVAGLAVNNLVSINAKWLPLLYGIPLLLIVASVLMMQFGGRSRPPSRLRTRLADAIEVLSARLRRAPRAEGVPVPARSVVKS